MGGHCFELVVHVDNMTIFGDDDGHCSPVKKRRKVPQGHLETKGEKISVTLVRDVLHVVCMNFTC